PVAGAGTLADAAAFVRAGDGRADHVLAALHAARPVAGDARPPVRLHGDPVAGLLRLRRPGDRALVPALPLQSDDRAVGAAVRGRDRPRWPPDRELRPQWLPAVRRIDGQQP